MDPDPPTGPCCPGLGAVASEHRLGRLNRVLIGNPRQQLATSPGCTTGPALPDLLTAGVQYAAQPRSDLTLPTISLLRS